MNSDERQRRSWLEGQLRSAIHRRDCVAVGRLARQLETLQRSVAAQVPPPMVRTVALPATIKALGTGQARTFEGICSTGERDHIGDEVVPTGVVWQGRPPILWQHDHRAPVGRATALRATADGVFVKGEIARIEEPGALQSLCDMARSALRHNLVSSLSVGFRPIETERLSDGKGLRFKRWHLHEISLVTIGANANAAITNVAAAS